MAISIEFKDKYVYFGPEAGLHTQGEARAEVYDVTGPRYHDGHDLSAMTWYVRAGNPDYMTIINKQLRVSVDPDNEGQIIITWPVEADFTAYAGQLDVQFVAKSSTGEEIIKLQSNGLQLAASVEGTVIPPRNMFEAAVEQIEQLADDAANAAAQSKLEADRAEDSQKAAAQSAQQAQKSVQDMQQSVKDAAELVKQIEGDAESAAASASDAAENASISKDWAAGKPVTYSGTPVSIAYAGAQRIDSLTLYGENAQGGTTEAPMALTGVDSVFVGGRNLLPKATKTQTIYGVTFTPNPDGSVSVSGTCAGGIATYNYADNLIPISPNQVVCLSGASQLVKVVINEKTPSGAFVRNVLVDRGQGISGTLTKQKEENILYATLQVQIGDTPNLTIYPMLNLGNTAMPYEPYQGSVTPLPIPRPLRRVGDVQDVCRTRVKSIYDKRIVLDGTESWYWYSDNSYIFASNFLADNKYGVAPGCSHYQGSPRHAPNENQVIINSNGTIAIKDPAWKNAEDAKAYLAAQKSAGTPVTVYYQSTAYDGTNGLDVCLTEYQTVFAELDGTESQFTYAATETKGLVVGLADDLEIGFLMLCSHGVYSSTGTESIRVWRLSSGKVGIYLPESLVTPYGYEGTVTTVKSAAAGYFAAQKEAGTPVQIAYQLATPETYATDPIDFDNAAGPLHVISGGELEVRMTELVGTRSDVSNNTVAFTETAQDADIASGEKLSVLFGKIKKRFSAMLTAIADRYTKAEAEARFMPNPNLLDNSDYKIAQAGYNGAHGSTGYLCDRWSKYIVTGSMTDDGMLLTPSGAGAWIIQYKLLTDTGLSEGDTVTLTVRVNGTVYSGSATLQIKSAAVDADSMVDTDDIRAAAFIPAGNTDQIAVYIVIKQTCTLTWTKLEKGSVATPYVPKGYGAELAECMRYFVGGVGIGSAGIVSGSTFRVLIPTPVPMRTAPSVTVKVADNVVYNGTFKALNTTVSNITRQRNGIHLHIGMAASGVNNYPGIAYGLQCDLSADL